MQFNTWLWRSRNDEIVIVAAPRPKPSGKSALVVISGAASERQPEVKADASRSSGGQRGGQERYFKVLRKSSAKYPTVDDHHITFYYIFSETVRSAFARRAIGKIENS